MHAINHADLATVIGGIHNPIETAPSAPGNYGDLIKAQPPATSAPGNLGDWAKAVEPPHLSGVPGGLGAWIGKYGNPVAYPTKR